MTRHQENHFCKPRSLSNSSMLSAKKELPNSTSRQYSPDAPKSENDCARSLIYLICDAAPKLPSVGLVMRPGGRTSRFPVGAADG